MSHFLCTSARRSSFAIGFRMQPRHWHFSALTNSHSPQGLSTRETKSSNSPPKVQFDYDKIRHELTQAWMTQEAKSPSGTTIKSRYCCFTLDDAWRAYQDPKSSWHWLDREMSSNLAGETGAVAIYTGALAAMRWRPTRFTPEAVDFCQAHQGNEKAHLKYFDAVVPHGKRTRLLFLWRVAGWTLGFVPTLVGGTRALYVTVEAVETFVEEHFQEQIVSLRKESSDINAPELLRLLEHCCEDEVHHKQDAAQRLLNMASVEKASSIIQSYWWVRPWTYIVQTGSAVAAQVARRV